MNNYKQLRTSLACVTSGNAKLGEVEYGDDGVDMARDIAVVLNERDRYKAALERIESIAKASVWHVQSDMRGLVAGIASEALTASEDDKETKT